MTIWAHCEWHNCEDDLVYDGALVVGLYTTKQTAEQALAKAGGHGYVARMEVRSKLM